MLTPWIAAIAVGVAVALSGCSVIAAPAGGSRARVVEPPASSAVPLSCTYSENTEGDVVREVTPPSPDPAVDGKPMIAGISTNLGIIEIKLDGEAAPCAVASFRHLAGEHFYDRSPCHRLTTQSIWVLQCGDPSGTGTGGPGYKYDDENLPEGESPAYPKGTVAMANAGPGTNGSQFFICYRDNPLPASYSVMGTVTKGLDIVEQVAAAGTDDKNGPGDGTPKRPISITSVTVRPAS